MSRKAGVMRALGERERLDLPQLAALFGCEGAAAQEGLRESLEVFEQEYGIAAGMLRPDDSLRLFTEPPVSKNPVSWLFNRAAFEDGASELNYQLTKRRRALGKPIASSPMTVGDYVRAWIE